MILAIDAGNTNLVFAVMSGAQRLHSWRIASDDTRTADEYAVWLMQLMRLRGLEVDTLEGCLVCSVRPGANAALRELCERYLGCKPLWVGEAPLDSFVPLDIEPGTRVGADRLVNAYEVARRGLAPAIVLDFGTATTFDLVDGQGRYGGGVIAPGPRLSLKALSEAAAHLPSVSLARPERVRGRNTVAAMQSGLFWGYMSLIEGLVTRLREEMRADGETQPISLVATGGLSRHFVEAGLAVNLYDPDLTMVGLAHLYHEV